MAHKKGQGSSRNGRDSNAKRLGLKVGNGQSILAGSIILKQRGTRVHPGSNVKRANDDSLFALKDGVCVQVGIQKQLKLVKDVLYFLKELIKIL